MDILLKTTVYLTTFIFLQKVFSSSAFECPVVRNQLLIADPEDCRNYYHCLPGGRVYVKTCPKGLVFDAKQKVCVWDSYSSCLTQNQKNELEDNIIVDVQKNKRLPVKKIQTIKPKKQDRKIDSTRRSTTTRRAKKTRTPTTTTTKPTTSTIKPTTKPKQHELIYEAAKTLGDYPDMAFEDDTHTLNRTEDGNETVVGNGLINDQVSSGDIKAVVSNTDDNLSNSAVGNFDDYSSFLFFPNRRLVKREIRRSPATYAYKIACPNAFAYVVEPDNCDIFYHCNNWKPFVKRCPPGLYFDATNYVCNWPHNVNCYEGKRTDSLFSFNEMRSEKFSKHVVKTKQMMEEKKSENVGYKVNPTTQKPKTTRVTTKPTPSSTTKDRMTINPEVVSTMGTTKKNHIQNEFTAMDNTDFEEGKSDETIFGKMKSESSPTTKAPLNKRKTTEKLNPKITLVNKYSRTTNMDQGNLYLFGKNPFSKPWIIETHPEEPSVRPTLLSKISSRNTDRYTTDNHRMNPFTKPNYEKYGTMRSRNIETKKSMDGDKEIDRPSIILVDNTHIGDIKYKTTRSRNVKDIYGRIKKVTGHTDRLEESTPKSVDASSTFRTSSIDYSATTDDVDMTTESYEATTANDIKANDSTTTNSSESNESPTNTNSFEATTTDSSIQSQKKIRKALADLEPSKYAAQNLTRVDNTTTEQSTDKSDSGNTTDALFEATTDKPEFTTKHDETTDDSKTTDNTKKTQSIFYTTTMTVVTDDQKQNTTTANGTDIFTTTAITFNVTVAENNTNVDNATVGGNDTASVKISSFRANIEDLIDTYHANFEGISFKSAAAGQEGSSSEESEGSDGSSESKEDVDEDDDGDVQNTIEGASFAAGKNKSDTVNSTLVSSTKSTSDTTLFAANKNVTKAETPTNSSSNTIITTESSITSNSNGTMQPTSNSTLKQTFTARTDNDTVNMSSTVMSDTSTTTIVTSKPSQKESKAVTDRSAMMVENKQEVKEVQIDSYMVKKLNRGHQPKHTELTPSDNMVDSDLNDTPAQGKDKLYEKKTEKWVLYGNVDKDKKEFHRKNKAKYSSGYENNETIDDKAAVVEEEVIRSNSEDNLDNSIIGFTDGESSGDIDSYRNAIMIDNTDSETKLLQYLSTEDESRDDHKSHNYFDVPVPYKRELNINSEAADTNKSTEKLEITTPKDTSPTSKYTTTSSVGTESVVPNNVSITNQSSSIDDAVEITLDNGTSNNSDTSNATLDQKLSFQNNTFTNSTEIPEAYKSNVSAVLHTKDSGNAVTEVSNSNVTKVNASDSKATMRLTKSAEKVEKGSLVSTLDVISSTDVKDTQNKTSFISLSDLIKWYLRHWKNYSQFKGSKQPEGDHSNAS